MIDGDLAAVLTGTQNHDPVISAILVTLSNRLTS